MSKAVQVKKLSPSKLKPNPDNPRQIQEHKFEELVKSLERFTEMLDARPLIIDENNVVLGGNQRLQAAIHLGLSSVPTIQVKGWTQEQKDEFVIADNISYGSWDWDVVANLWDSKPLGEWGLKVPVYEFFDVNDDTPISKEPSNPSIKDDDYSSFDLVMLHDNKMKLMEILNRIKREEEIDKLEDALMYLTTLYNE